MKKFYFILMAMVAMVGFVACENNNSELKNQPLNNKGELNKYWTPDGHTYVGTLGDRSIVLTFEDKGFAYEYSTNKADIFDTEGIETYQVIYQGYYPDFVVTYCLGERNTPISFSDTLTLDYGSYHMSLVR